MNPITITPEMDDLDIAAAYLKANPDKIRECWECPDLYWAGRLFCYLSPTDPYKSQTVDNGRVVTNCGCLTQVRHNGLVCFDRSLEQEIKEDETIPEDDDISPEDLERFVYYQRKARVLRKVLSSV